MLPPRESYDGGLTRAGFISDRCQVQAGLVRLDAVVTASLRHSVPLYGFDTVATNGIPYLVNSGIGPSVLTRRISDQSSAVALACVLAWFVDEPLDLLGASI